MIVQSYNVGETVIPLLQLYDKTCNVQLASLQDTTEAYYIYQKKKSRKTCASVARFLARFLVN